MKLNEALHYLNEQLNNTWLSPQEKAWVDSWNGKYPLKHNGIVCCIIELAFTHAILFDVGPDAWEERYCFEDREALIIEYARWRMRGFNNEPPIGWVATRQDGLSRLKDRMEAVRPNYGANVLTYLKTDPTRQYSAPSSQTLKSLGVSRDEFQHLLAYLKQTGQLDL